MKFHLILVYLGRYTIKLLLTESSDHTGNICSDTEGAWTERKNKYFLIWTSCLVNKCILLTGTRFDKEIIWSYWLTCKNFENNAVMHFLMCEKYSNSKGDNVELLYFAHVKECTSTFFSKFFHVKPVIHKPNHITLLRKPNHITLLMILLQSELVITVVAST